MSDVYQSLAHSKQDCKYHVVFVPKRRRKAIFGNIRRQLGGNSTHRTELRRFHIVYC
jgi:putative transposase